MKPGYTRLLGISVLAIALTGCGPYTSNESTGTLVGVGAGALIGSQFGHGGGQVASTLVGAALGGLLGGAIGSRLDEADRRAAYYAQSEAFAYNTRRSWRGPNAYGYVDPGPMVSGDPYGYRHCREYSSMIVVGGRPTRGYGVACLQPDGSWRIIQ